MATALSDRIRVAHGEGKADLLIKNGKVVNVFSGQVEKKDVAIYDGIIVGFGDYRAKKVVDVNGQFLCPGLIDGHVHVESSMVTIPEFARAVVPHGTTSVVIDPHEIANVLGVRGIRFMTQSAKNVPLNVFIMIPSCVPATHLETSGATLTSSDIRRLLKEPWAIGLAEMMNFPGVIFRNPDVLKKIEVARGKRIDGHAPLLTGKGLYAYLTAGIRSDHECTAAFEAKEKLKNGMWIMIREGTAARNLKDLLPLVTPENSRRFFFVSDDSHPRELLEVGHVDSIVRKAIALGCNPILAIQMATINAAEYFRLDNLGAIAPGFCADIVVFDQFSRFEITKVFKDGILVSKDGQVARSRVAVSADRQLQSIGSVRIGAVRKDSLVLQSDNPLTKVIQLVPDQIVTKKVMKKITLRDGVAYPDLKQDILKIAVVERHHASGNVGVGFVQGFGLKKGAIGSSVAHDSHNLVVVGTNDEDMWEAIRSLQSLGGGMVAVCEREMISSVPLPIAGLMANASVRQVHEQMQGLLASAKTLGCKLPDPFMILSFLSLPVIPELKLTDRGLVDVSQFKIVPLFGED